MDVTPVISEGKKVIKSYGSGLFKVNEDEYNSSIIISSDNVIKIAAKSLEDLTQDSFSDFPEDIEILLIGGGENHPPIRNDLIDFFRKKDINIEFMGTGAACRTYNVLLSEERSVAAALIII